MRPRHIILPLAAGLLAGCARTPAGVSSGSGTLVTFQVQFAGPVNPGAFYFIVINTDPGSQGGPAVVTQSPWGNGFASGSYTHYVEYNGNVFNVTETPNNPDHVTNIKGLGRPLDAGVTTVNTPNDTLQVTLDTAQILDLFPNSRSLRVNFITASRLPLDTQDAGGDRATDGLGVSGNDYITIPLDQTNTYTNGANSAFGVPEGPNDGPNLGANPGLDIVNWRVTVQTNR